jgi:hypothetical protein
VVGVGVVDARRGDLVELLAVPEGRVGQVDDVEDLGPPKRVICTARLEIRLSAAADEASRDAAMSSLDANSSAVCSARSSSVSSSTPLPP